MGNYRFFVGVDVSKATLDFCLRSPSGTALSFQVANSKAGHAKAMRALSREPGFEPSACLLCMEHTGIYALPVAAGFRDAGYCVWMENASRIRQGAGEIIRGKDDKVDAARIAEYAFRFSDRAAPWVPPRPELVQLRELQQAREQLKKAAHLLKVGNGERRAVLGGKGAHDRGMEAVLARIRKEIAAVEKKIRELIRSDEQLRKLHGLITSVGGVADVTATAILVATDGFTRFLTARKLACHAGCAPFPHRSGSSIRGKSRVSHRADKNLKSLLNMCALAAVTMEGDLKEYYLRKTGEGKHKLVVINAVRGKLIHRIYACVRDGRKWTKSVPANTTT